MAAVLHGSCGSPRSHTQSHHISSITSANGGGDYLTSVQQQHHTSSAPMYPTMPKYARHSPQPLTTPNHLHGYTGGNGGAGHKYTSSLPAPVSYMPVLGAASQPHLMHQAGYGTAHRIASASASDMCRNYWSHPQHAATLMYRNARNHSKRKSAVELLAETKPFYIRSDAVLERLQQASYRSPGGVGGGSGSGNGSKRGRNHLDCRDELRCGSSYRDNGVVADGDRRFSPTTHQLNLGSSGRSAGTHLSHHHHHSHHTHIGRHMTVSSGSNLLQNKLRMLLNNEAGSRERGVMGPRSNERYRSEQPRQFDFGAASCTNELPSNAPFGKEDECGLRMAQTSFISPKPFDAVYNYGGETSSGDEPLVLTENYRPISPPAEYAAENSQANNEQRSRYNYQRSYSHSHEVPADNAAAYNINSHKSLPDLHSQTSRHSPHSEILSCCSRGNRSIKSAGESSLNRDSGGSSGHYTHRSEPCYRQQQHQQEGDHDSGAYGHKTCCNSATPMEYRRDSGSSTQHSANSYCGYVSPSYAMPVAECAECQCNTAAHFDSTEFLFNFTTPEVPEAFQDDYTPPSPSVRKYKIEEPRYSSSSSHQMLTSQVGYSAGGIKHASQSSIVQSPGSAPSLEDISPPPIQFKRQKCIRFKNRKSRISLPHGSATKDTLDAAYQKTEQPHSSSAFIFPKCFSADGYPTQEKLQSHSFNEAVCSSVTAYSLSDLDERARDSNGVLELEKFFDRLGLNDDKFHEIYSTSKRRRSAESNSDDSSTVFFSDVSTVDSMRLPDSTETQPQATQTYRPSEPPSIVERNARIIKWLCNCRKLQYT